MAQEAKVMTPFGTLELHATDAKHIYCTSNFKTADNQQNVLTVNNVDYNVSFHMHRWDTGEWHIGPQFKENGTNYPDWERMMNHFFARRCGTHDPATEAARKKMLAQLPLPINNWARANLITLQKADVEALTTKANKLNEEIAALKAELKQKETELAGIVELRDAKVTMLEGQ